MTDNEHGLDGGGVINFIEVNRNLRFEISLNAADRSGLKINSALLSVAARVERGRRARSIASMVIHTDSAQWLPHQDGQRRNDQREMRGLSSRIIIAAVLASLPRRFMRSCWPMPAIR